MNRSELQEIIDYAKENNISDETFEDVYKKYKKEKENKIE